MTKQRNIYTGLLPDQTKSGTPNQIGRRLHDLLHETDTTIPELARKSRAQKMAISDAALYSILTGTTITLTPYTAWRITHLLGVPLERLRPDLGPSVVRNSIIGPVLTAIGSGQYSSTSLAEAAHVSESTIYRASNGLTISVNEGQRIAAVLGCTYTPAPGQRRKKAVAPAPVIAVPPPEPRVVADPPPDKHAGTDHMTDWMLLQTIRGTLSQTRNLSPVTAALITVLEYIRDGNVNDRDRHEDSLVWQLIGLLEDLLDIHDYSTLTPRTLLGVAKLLAYGLPPESSDTLMAVREALDLLVQEINIPEE